LEYREQDELLGVNGETTDVRPALSRPASQQHDYHYGRPDPAEIRRMGRRVPLGYRLDVRYGPYQDLDESGDSIPAPGVFWVEE